MPITLGTNGYCERADVQEVNQQRTYSASTRPTAEQVDGFITDVFSEMNLILNAAGYTTPVATSATAASAWLKVVNAWGAAGMAEEATHSVGAPGESARSDSLMKRYRDRLKMISAKEITLKDAARSDASPKIQSEQVPAGSFNLDADGGSERAATYTRTMDF